MVNNNSTTEDDDAAVTIMIDVNPGTSGSSPTTLATVNGNGTVYVLSLDGVLK